LELVIMNFCVCLTKTSPLPLHVSTKGSVFETLDAKAASLLFLLLGVSDLKLQTPWGIWDINILDWVGLLGWLRAEVRVTLGSRSDLCGGVSPLLLG